MSAKKAITPTTPKSTMQSTTSQQSPIVIQSLKTTPSTSSSKTTMLEEDENANELSMEFEQQLNELESLLNPFFQLNSEDLHRKLTQQELAQLDIIRAYCINTLFYMFLKTQGVSTAEHPVKEELERVKTYMKKIKELSQKTPSKPPTKVDVSAANRFITHALAPKSTNAQQQ